MIVDGDMSELPTHPPCGIRLPFIACDAVTYCIEPAQLFDVQVDDLAGAGTLVTGAGLLRLKSGQQAQAAALENARDGGRGDADLTCDMRLDVALAA